jgi:SAM-dependent methyltransferase
VDFSPRAIDAARTLAAQTGVPAEFVCTDLYDVRSVLSAAGKFDIVYTSYGVLCWLPDLVRWGQIIAHYLKPGGFFYVVEAHPTARIFPTDEDIPQAGSLRPWFGYFHDPAGLGFPGGQDYADPSITNTSPQHVWQHSMGDIINALTAAGLRIDWLHEFPYCAWPVVAGCEVVERSSGGQAYYGLPASQPQIPLMFSLKASKPPVEPGASPMNRPLTR